MSLVDDAFQVFLRGISPPPTQISLARQSHNALRDFLETDSYFGDLTQGTFLNGSYARHTAIRPMKDVDIIAVVDTEWLQDDPSAAMKSLQRKLSQRYRDWRTRRRRRAVKVGLSTISLDVVLAVAPNGLEHPLRIPDRDLKQWITTDPKRQLALVADLTAKTDSNYSRLVRFLKAWCRERIPGPYRPSSFVLECAVYRVVVKRPDRYAGELREAFYNLLQDLHAWDFGRRDAWLSFGQPLVPDPALPDVNVAKGWDGNRADRVMEGLALAVRRAEAALGGRWDDSEVNHWRTLFGGAFPAVSTLDRQRREVSR